ncbi:MAG TPA: hypothetical protein DHV62_07345, partial [Elusimicrobia bacterium]|nr:hypothetical protein [Elusimicrobiota bacterium]
MSKAIIITVGTGETVSHGICCAIRQQNPNYIVFCLTKESEVKTLPLILQDETMKDRKYDGFILKDENDVEEIRFECQQIIEGLFKKNFAPKDIVVDYTPGTKAMSAGVVLAALDKKLGTLVYVAGKRNKNGRVVSGTEKVISLEPNRTYADSLFKGAVDLFNSCQFDSSLEIVKEAQSLISDIDFAEKISLLKDLVSA